MPTEVKPLLIFVPGLGATGAVYAPLLKQLGRDFNVRLADLPSQLPNRLTWPFLEQVINQAAGDTKRFRLLGHSMGGATVLHYAARNPDRVERAVAVAPVIWHFQSRVPIIKKKLRSLLLALSSLRLVHFYRVSKIRRWEKGEGRAEIMYGWTHQIDLRPELPKLRSAVVLIPQHEELIPTDQYDVVRRDYQGVILRNIPGSHNSLALASGRLIRIIRKELDG